MFVPKKLIHWYITSLGLLAVYPNKARAPVCPADVLRHEAQPLEGSDSLQSSPDSRNSGKLLSHSLMMSAFYLTLVGLMFSGGWAVGGERHYEEVVRGNKR